MPLPGPFNRYRVTAPPPTGESGPGREFPLTSATGEVTVTSIRCGESCRSRLASLGITPGVRIRVLRNTGGPLLLDVRGSRLALGRGIAAKVFVTAL
ncbi:ferrous iron transport protein A [Thermoplasmatales archaeon ex4484_36]|nr:MAG: ferrous iron transport protein A [Thermoplasmatales archaeon ex4484_36]RLF70506.1 MAG: ferrous iron transport protein A [Thermoplasmata archaeon]RLF74668.1 MAG: ferrous iron transport protein A [Thermoplasmata archaeon]